MSDIVERLRQKERDYYQRDTGGAYGMGPVLRDAADEIERLRGVLRDINSRPRHLNAGAWEIRLYQDDYDRIDAALAGEPEEK